MALAVFAAGHFPIDVVVPGQEAGLEMAGDVVPDPARKGAQVAAELAFLVKPPQKGRQLDGLIGNESRVEIADEVEVILPQHDGGSGFGAEDGEAQTCEVGQVVEIAASEVASRLRVKLFEYMAAGRAVVASDLPGIAEVVQDGESALLVPAGDAVGEDVDEVDDLGAVASARQPGPAAAGGAAQEGLWRERR